MIIYLQISTNQLASLDAICMKINGVEKRLEWDETIRTHGFYFFTFKLKGVYYVAENGEEIYANNSLTPNSQVEDIRLLWEENEQIDYKIEYFKIEDNETTILVKGENE